MQAHAGHGEAVHVSNCLRSGGRTSGRHPLLRQFSTASPAPPPRVALAGRNAGPERGKHGGSSPTPTTRDME